VGRDDGKQGGEFCPVFYREDRFEMLEKQTRWLSETPQVPGSKSWDTSITRLVTMIRFRDRQSDKKFWIFNTHFDHRGSEARENSAQLVRKWIAQFSGDLPVAVTGDFNCTPSSQPYSILTDQQGESRLIDSHQVSDSPPTGPDSTWCGFREVVPGRRIDFIFVTPGMDVLRHQTIDKQFNGRFPSDHLPVVAELEF